jgi:hypothetical protein
MSRFEAIESRHYVNNAGRTASIYGAAPWVTEAQRIGEVWRIVHAGYTVRDNERGTVGYGRPPLATMAEAQALAAQWNAEHETRHAAHRARAEKASAPIGWRKVTGNDGIGVWHSGEGYSVRCEAFGFVVVCDDGAELFPMRTLAKAKAWCAASISRQRMAALLECVA